MTWQSVFFSANGRMNRNDFWIAALALIGAWFLSLFLHALAFVAFLVLAYCWVCILSKRLHDAGRSGWLNLIPLVVGFGAMIVTMVIGGVAMVTAISAGGNLDWSPGAMFWGSLGIFAAAVWGATWMVDLIFLLWVGLSAGDTADNRYGPPASPWLKSTTPPAAA
jgi:uncharacterized membrane protein YhaH (DUF805 family)